MTNHQGWESDKSSQSPRGIRFGHGHETEISMAKLITVCFLPEQLSPPKFHHPKISSLVLSNAYLPLRSLLEVAAPVLKQTTLWVTNPTLAT